MSFLSAVTKAASAVLDQVKPPVPTPAAVQPAAQAVAQAVASAPAPTTLVAVPPDARAAAIAASSNPELARTADHRYADSSDEIDPYAVYLDPSCPADGRTIAVDDALASLHDGAHFDDLRPILEGRSPLGALSEREQTRVLDFATNAWRNHDGYRDLDALTAWSGQDRTRAAFVSHDLATRALAYESVYQAHPEIPIVQSFQQALAVAAVDAPGTPGRRREMIDALGPDAGILFAELQTGENNWGVGNMATGYSPELEERAEAAALLLDACRGGPTEGSAAVVAAGLSELTDDALQASRDLADFRDTVDLGSSFAHALAAETHPDDPAQAREEGDRLAEILATRDGRALVFSADRPLGARVETLLTVRAHPEWGTDLDPRRVEQAMLEPRARDLLELRGDAPMRLPGTDLENTVGMAFGFAVQGVPDDETEAQRNAREAGVAAGRYSLFTGEPAEGVIQPVVDQIRHVGGPDPQVTVLPIRIHDGDGAAVDLPLFRVQDGATGEDRFVDQEGRRYSSFDDWRHHNGLPSGRMIFPAGGHLTESGGGSVALQEGATPSTRDSAWEHFTHVADIAAVVGGTIAGGLLIVGSGGTAAPFVVGGAAAWGAYRSGDRLHDRYAHGQSINPLTDSQARALWLNAGADALTAATLGTSEVAARLGGAASALRPQAAAAAAILGAGATAIDATAAANVGWQLIRDWDQLSGSERAQLSLSLGFWSAGTAIAARRAFPNGIEAWLPGRNWSDAQYRDLFMATASPEARAELGSLTPSQLRALYPAGSVYPVGLDTAARFAGFGEFAAAHPAEARVLTEGVTYFDPAAIQSSIHQIGFSGTASRLEGMLPVITPARGQPGFVVVQRGPDTPDYFPERAIYPTTMFDHNGAFQQPGLALGRTTESPRRVPTEVPLAQGPLPSQLRVNGEPLASLDGVMVFGAHGSPSQFSGATTEQAATMVADQVAAARAAGRSIDYVVLDACDQRDRRMLIGRSNAERFQTDLRAALASRGLPQDVTVLAASRGGPTYGNGQRDWFSRTWRPAEYTPADDGAALYVSHGSAALAALGAVSVGEGYLIYEALDDD